MPIKVALATEPTMSFSDWLAAQALYYRSLGTESGDWLAERLETDALTARMVRASSPSDFDKREEEMIESDHARLRAEGYDCAVDNFGLPS